MRCFIPKCPSCLTTMEKNFWRWVKEQAVHGLSGAIIPYSHWRNTNPLYVGSNCSQGLMKELLRQPSPSVKGKRGRGLGLRLTSTHITAVLGIFTLVSSPAAAGTTTPGSAHGDKLTRWSFRPSSSHPGTQTLGRWTNKLFILQSVILPHW